MRKVAKPVVKATERLPAEASAQAGTASLKNADPCEAGGTPKGKFKIIY